MPMTCNIRENHAYTTSLSIFSLMARTLQYTFAVVIHKATGENGGSQMNFTRLPAFAFILTLFFVNPILITAQRETSGINELKSGTKIRVQMDNEINSESSGSNDTFTTVVAEPVSVRDVVILPIGATIEGRITKVEKASTGGNNGNLEVVFETLILENGIKRNIEAVLVNKLEAKTSKSGKVLMIIGGTALGGLIGAVSNVENGALIGAGIGAGAGTGTALLQKGKDVRIKAEEKFDIQLTKSVTLPAEGF